MSTLITAKNKAVQEEKLVQTGAVQYVQDNMGCEGVRPFEPGQSKNSTEQETVFQVPW